MEAEHLAKDVAPLRARDERRNHVGSEHERQPFQRARHLPVAQSYGAEHDAEPEQHDPDVRVDAAQQLGRIGHAREIGADVYGVRAEQQHADDDEHRARIALSHGRHQTAARDHADARARHLDGPHQWPRHEGHPEQTGAELRARERVRRNAGRIVVRRTRNEPGAEGTPEARDPASGLHDGIASSMITARAP